MSKNIQEYKQSFIKCLPENLKSGDTFSICSEANEKAFKFVDHCFGNTRHVQRFIINKVVYVAFYVADNALCPEHFVFVAPEYLGNSVVVKTNCISENF